MTETIRLTPHHVVNIIDLYHLGNDPSSDMEYQDLRGMPVGNRIRSVLGNLLEDPETEIEIVRNTENDFICHGRNGETPCNLGHQLRGAANCYLPFKQQEEDRIAKDLDLKYGQNYPFSDLVYRRERTDFGR